MPTTLNSSSGIQILRRRMSIDECQRFMVAINDVKEMLATI